MKTSTYAAFALAALPFALVACEDKPPPKPPAPVAAAAPAASASAAAAPAATKSGPEYTDTDFLENDRNRDPFRSYIELTGGDKTTRLPKNQVRVVLRQFPIEDLKLAAIVQGADYPRAMLIPPGGKGSIIKRGDFVGKEETVHTGGSNGTDYLINWRVDKVRDGDVVLVLQDRMHPEAPPATKVITLHPDSEKMGQPSDEDLLGQGQDQL